MEKSTFYDIYDYYYQPFWQTIYFKILIVLATLTIISLIVFWYIRRKKQIETPHEWALKALSNLPLEHCETKKDFKKFYFDITSIIKEYFFRRFGWFTQNKTDEELIPYLKEQGFNPELLASMEKMFSGSVWIKFANEEVIKTQAQADYKIAKQVIEKTKPTDTENEKKAQSS